MAKEQKIIAETNEIKGEPNKRLTERQRMEIQGRLAHGVCFKDIGRRIGKNQTTGEVEQHLSVQPATSKDRDASTMPTATESAFDVFSFIHSAQIARSLGIQRIDPSQVIQSPTLLR